MASGRATDTIQQAMSLHRQGRAAEAATLYRAALARDPRAFEPCYLLALLCYQQGSMAEAHRLILRAVEVKPRSTDALALLAGVLLALDRPSDALPACDQILALEPADTNAACNRAAVLTRLDRLDEAIAQYGEVLARRPGLVPALLNRGTLLARRGRYQEALADLDRVLASAPNNIETLINRGNVLAKLGRCEEALAQYDRVLTQQPANIDALSNRGATLKSLSRTEEALASYEKALTVNPRHVDSRFNCGNLLLELGQPEAALAEYERALAVDDRRTDLLVARANALARLDRTDAAIQAFEEVLGSAPGDTDALLNFGHLLARLGRHRDAEAAYERLSAASSGRADLLAKCAQSLANIRSFEPAARDFRRVIELEREDPAAWCGLANCLSSLCDWSELDAVREKIDALVAAGKRVDPLLYVRLLDDPAGQLACARGYAPSAGAGSARAPRGGRDGKIRVTYMSPDFRKHAVAFLIAELFEQHDRDRFDVFGLSLGPDDGSAIRRRISDSFDQFHDVRLRSDEEIAALIARLETDILVDLGGFTEFGRSGVLARRAAPVQVNYLGFPGTLGADYVDYIVADPIVAPFDQQNHFAEKIVHLPDCYQPNDSKRTISPHLFTRAEAGLPEHGIVFCCFNANFKILPPVFDVWMRLLRNIENSVLWLLAAGDRQTANLRQACRDRGVDPGRLVFAPRMELSEHLARHRVADIFLDTLPYNAHTTASDALWAGLPVLTCRGRGFAARVAASLLEAVGLPELVTDSLADYEALAAELARDTARLRSIRSKLEENRLTWPLFDARRSCRHLEAAYATMQEAAVRGDAPRSFAVAPISPRVAVGVPA
jgi:protein O-GlcNAc transferase